MKAFAKVLYVILGILMMIAGFYCLFTPSDTYMAVFGYAVGLSMVIDSVGLFIYWFENRKTGYADGWTLTAAVLSAVLGFFVLNNTALQLAIDAFIAYYIAVWLVLRGILVIVHAWKIRKLHKNWDTKMLGRRWYLPLCIGILMCCFGILCCFMPSVMTTSLGIFIGLGIIATGADIISLAINAPEA